MSDDNTKKKKDDPEFDQYIRELKPNWFDDKAQNKKDQLIELATNGYQRPKPNYDPEFDQYIRKLKPNWFESDTATGID